MKFADLVDQALEFPIAPSFTRIGYDVRKRLANWSEGPNNLAGRVIVVTGATSGLGRAAAEVFAAAGATLVVVGRRAERNQAVVDEIVAASGNERVSQLAADMGDLDQVRALGAELLATFETLDVLIHNAGALAAERTDAPDGTEATVASQVVGPFLLTTLLLDRMVASGPSRVITMSSGGMYSSPLRVKSIEMSAGEYKGAEQYARAKRAQVTLNALWADRYGDRGVSFHAMHPGWAATPGVTDALPTFEKVLGPLLRSPDQGADTLVWLATADEPLAENGLFWHDRRPRRVHRLPTTTKSDTRERRAQLWDWVAERAGQSPA